ncbi:hypothetical protein MCAP1_003311 [Malassezia caprae]|uniref:CCDC174 alpha/beta GRSR domain-containing protein n=1 Tax=Malassezia caprae TaxID=1381934 RepID=A0AAF0J1I2_9BASI|nr:hypothetical protein MCAP1_003311 [Malassezia caprae]
MLRASARAAAAPAPQGPLRLRTEAPAAAPPRDADPEQLREAASARALPHKAARYDKLAQGYGLADDGLVDWDAKDPVSPSTPSPPPTDDELVEYTDEFGRTRTARKSDVPREYARERDEMPEEDNAVYGPATAFPVYRREVPQLDTRIAQRAEAVHFDADWEVRDRGAAFYRFSHDAATREAQQAELQARRAETVAQRSKSTHTTAPVPGARARARRAARQQVIDAHRAAR